MANTLPKNIDQSEKAQKGNDFNEEITNTLTNLQLNNFQFVMKEPIFQKIGINADGYFEKFSLQMDHWFFFCNHKDKIILSVLSDGTTSHRDRTKIKAFEGLVQSHLYGEIEQQLFSKYPQLNGYDVVHTSLLLFPSVVTTKNATRDIQNIKKCCISINYKLDSLCSRTGTHLIDAAVTENELIEIINELSTNIDKYTLSSSLLSEIWKNIYHTYDCKPIRPLTINSAQMHKTQLLHNLQNNPKAYSKQDIQNFAQANNIGFKCKTNKDKIKELIHYIENNF